jgi:hypothetical protein
MSYEIIDNLRDQASDFASERYDLETEGDCFLECEAEHFTLLLLELKETEPEIFTDIIDNYYDDCPIDEDMLEEAA